MRVDFGGSIGKKKGRYVSVICPEIDKTDDE
jgi:hypothetical protein